MTHGHIQISVNSSLVEEDVDPGRPGVMYLPVSNWSNVSGLHLTPPVPRGAGDDARAHVIKLLVGTVITGLIIVNNLVNLVVLRDIRECGHRMKVRL